ncbi:hypothetical protein CDO73_06735 [Saccharibacillus sp. O23]|uniref:heparinase II/III domain-containing protein n=1 Tax=Saccharibacillus sp. O23 TaxID=2009338 RepID=UPI000B4E4F77|nr:heparinase II/III family protein [Saccharibacillus sp. O23]OWR31421.1 hypothetical protein CDO73_06735 [Saccharibacillus sp. O23]
MLLYDGETLARSRRLIETVPAMTRGWNKFAAEMSSRDDRWSEEAREKVALLRERWKRLGGSKLFSLGNEVRELAKQAQNLAYYARMTGSSEAERRVRSLLALLGEEERWVYQSGGGRNSDLWTADIGVYLSAAYDAVRSGCTPQERSAIEDMLYEKAYLPLYEDWLHPVKKIHALDTMGHNWWIVCVSAAGLLILTLGDRVPHGEDALHAVTEGLREWFAYPGNVLQNKQANFGPDGDYVETMGYLDYALGNFFVFETAYRRRTGDETLGELPVLAKIPGVYLETIYRKKTHAEEAERDRAGEVGTFHFGDDGDRRKHAYVWLRLADLTRRGELLGLFADIKGDPAEAAELAFYPEGLEELPPVSDETEGITVLEHSGYGFVRWQSGGQQIVLAVKTGESWNHNHLDAGTFMLTVGGAVYADDSGHCAYSKPLYNGYYRQSAAHNVVLLDGRGQPPALIEEGTKFPGSIPDWLDAPDYKYLLADCVGPYSGLYRRFYRHFLCLEGAMIVIDDLQSEQGGMFEWLLHMPAGLKITTGTAEPSLSIAGSSGEMKVLHPYPRRKEYAKRAGYLHAPPRETGREDEFPEADYAGVRSRSADGRMKFVSAFLLPERGERKTTVRRLEAGESAAYGGQEADRDTAAGKLSGSEKEGGANMAGMLRPGSNPSESVGGAHKVGATDSSAGRIEGDDTRVAGMSYGFEAKMLGEHAASQAEELGAAFGEALSPREDPGEDVQALRLERPDGAIVDVFVNLRADGRVMHENAHAVFGGLETDAFLCTLSYGRDGRLRRATLHNGSYLKLNGRCLFSSLLKASAAISYRGGEVEVGASLSADAWCYFSPVPPEQAAGEAGGGSMTPPEREAYVRQANAAARSASHPSGEADVRFDPLSGLWKRKMPAGRSSFRLPLGASASQPIE